MSSITHNSIETEEIIKALRKENESLRMMGSPVVEATIQHQAMEIMKLKETIATLNESLSITSQGNAKLKQQVATLQGIEAIANEYGIDGFVEIEELREERDSLEGLLRDSQCEHKRCIEALDMVMRDSRNAHIGESVLARTAKEE